MSTGSRNIWEAWARSVPPLVCASTREPCHDPAATATRLARAGLAGQYVVYESEGGVWHFAAGSDVSVTADATGITARAAGRTWTSRTQRRPLTAFADALAALPPVSGLPDESGEERRFYGWAAFELAHLLHADPATAGDRPLLHALIPSVEVTLTGDSTVIRAVDEAWARKVADLLAEPAAEQTPHDEPARDRTEDVIAVGTAAYGRAVSRTVRDIRAGLLEKAVVSRQVPLPAEPRPDFPATYLAGRRANTPARSYVLDLGGYRAAGFSPETVLEVEDDGRVSTQPLAGTRALGADPAENERRRAELLSDPKEIHEHAVSVRLAWEEMAAVCRPGSVVVEEYMAVRPRGSVQHLASRVTGGSGRTPDPGTPSPRCSPRSPPPESPNAPRSRPWPATRKGHAACTAGRSSGEHQRRPRRRPRPAHPDRRGRRGVAASRRRGHRPVQPRAGDRGDLRETPQRRPVPEVLPDLT